MILAEHECSNKRINAGNNNHWRIHQEGEGLVGKASAKTRVCVPHLHKNNSVQYSTSGVPDSSWFKPMEKVVEALNGQSLEGGYRSEETVTRDGDVFLGED